MSEKEFTGDAGTIYLRYDENEDEPYDLWLEDFCILGSGKSEMEALDAAWRHTGNIMPLIAEARIKLVNATPAPSGE